MRTRNAFDVLIWKCASHHSRVHFYHMATSNSAPKLRFSAFLTFLPSTCASHHNSMHFSISHLATWLRTHRFSEPTSRPSGVKKLWKNTVLRDFSTFSRAWIFFLLIFFHPLHSTDSFSSGSFSPLTALTFAALLLLSISWKFDL